MMSKTPTEPGYYWARFPDDEWEVMRVFKVNTVEGPTLEVDSSAWKMTSYRISDIHEWGPRVPPPEFDPAEGWEERPMRCLMYTDGDINVWIRDGTFYAEECDAEQPCGVAIPLSIVIRLLVADVTGRELP